MAIIRRVLLIIAALVFAGIGIASFLVPDRMALPLGFVLDNTNARSEFTAVYVGIWLVTSALLFTAVRHPDDVRLGDFGALLILGQTFGRILSAFRDGLPSSAMYGIAFVECIGGIAILATRPRRSAPKLP
ncbi:DUF4345 family protein [Candidatus Uhrbacteria bacterium]|nr:DUF4345 family protein [Candidatus Uhrbacteria bacterium]